MTGAGLPAAHVPSPLGGAVPGIPEDTLDLVCLGQHCVGQHGKERPGAKARATPPPLATEERRDR
jgi:hypothetical protein